MSKVVEYVGWFHALKDQLKESWTQFWLPDSSGGCGPGPDPFVDDRETNFRVKVKEKLERLKHQTIRRIDRSSSIDEDFSHLTRSKTRRELLRVSAAVMGIEFSYAAETAFVSPLLLNLGLRHRHMTLMWCLSPMVGFFATPLLGSLSDGCRSQLGRRRPFILLLSIGIILGLILVPNGKTIGRLLGDTYKDDPPPPISMLKSNSPIPPRVLSTSPKPIQPIRQLNLIHQQVDPFGEFFTRFSRDLPGINAPKNVKMYSNLTSEEEQNSLIPSTTLRGINEIHINPSNNKNSSSASSKHLFSDDQEHPPLLDPYKTGYSSKHGPIMEQHGFLVRNNLRDEGAGNSKEFMRALQKRFGKLKMLRQQDRVVDELPTLSPRIAETETDLDLNEDSELEMGQMGEILNSREQQEGSGEKIDNFNITNEVVEGNGAVKFSKSLLAKGEGIGGEDGGLTAEINEQEKADGNGEGDKSRNEDEESALKNHPWGLFFTVLGTVLLDFDADACQSPSRAYMLDVTIPEDHARGLSTFTVMAGLGGSLGYFLGAVNWENTFIGHFFGGQVRAVFTLVLFIFIGCVITTIRSFREIPIDRLWANQPGAEGSLHESNRPNPGSSYSRFEEEPDPSSEYPKVDPKPSKSYGSTGPVSETSFNGTAATTVVPDALANPVVVAEVQPTFREYVKTIVQLPKSLQWLCVTNFFCWMSLVCYSLYFTDFVGEAVFGGDPSAPLGTVSRTNYDDGVRFGCWGMSLYSLSCSLYSLCIESLVSRFGAKRVYITGQLVYSVGMICMAIARHPFGVIVFSWTAGIMYATLFTMPYLLVARYHAAETFDIDVDDLVSKPSQMRGLGTDVAIVSSMVFLAQMTQALLLGSVVAATGSTTAVVVAAAIFASCGAVAATKVLYLDL